MKKLFLILMLVLTPALCFGIGASINQTNTLSVYAESSVLSATTEPEQTPEVATPEEEKSEGAIFFEEKILPVLISVGTSISAFIIAFGPILSVIKKGANMFMKAKESLSESTETASSTTKQLLDALAEQSETIRLLREEVKTTKESMTAELAECKKHAQNAVEIAKIGFGNTTELVKNGYANAIQKVGQNEENKESEEN